MIHDENVLDVLDVWFIGCLRWKYTAIDKEKCYECMLFIALKLEPDILSACVDISTHHRF